MSAEHVKRLRARAALYNLRQRRAEAERRRIEAVLAGDVAPARAGARQYLARAQAAARERDALDAEIAALEG